MKKFSLATLFLLATMSSASSQSVVFRDEVIDENMWELSVEVMVRDNKIYHCTMKKKRVTCEQIGFASNNLKKSQITAFVGSLDKRRKVSDDVVIYDNVIMFCNKADGRHICLPVGKTRPFK